MDLGYYIKFIISSIAIIGVLMVILKSSKNLQKKHMGKDIKIIDRVATGTQSNVFLIDVKGTQYLIGATNTSIRLIDKLWYQ